MNRSNIHSPRGNELTCKNWQIEAPYRMIQNNLDPEVAENAASSNPDEHATAVEVADALTDFKTSVRPDGSSAAARSAGSLYYICKVF